ncbi:bile acid-CoA:amino acid N-acyltransferase isoform X2 [Chanos chanos]|uniref:Bile acid-CoA:amino acid N-acyltransferase isoform X2 n=1 Tax=Chanos chanos TaxID=29144 RepID=A0A6J2VH83_CHACN|nr:bile acid-CoA:amino acid N-acyltransferase-like isoform X2 [Chanos chanos]
MFSSSIRELLCLRQLYRAIISGQRCKAQVGLRTYCRPAPLLTASPTRALIDELITVEGCFLTPNSPITVRARMHSEDGDLWESLAYYYTDGRGTVNLNRDSSIGGSYVGCEPMGLFWSLQAAPGEREGLRLRKRDVETPYLVDLSVLQGHISSCDGAGGQGMRAEQEVAAVKVERWYMSPGVRRVEIRQNGVVGTLFMPPGPGPFPGVLDLWGMGGGLVEYRSALFASHGLASFALAYFDHKDIPGPAKRVNVKDSYFKTAFEILQNHPQICSDRVAVVGLSFGVYLTLKIATQLSVNPSCIICINGPLGSFNKSFNENGVSGTFDEHQEYWSYDEHNNVSFREMSSPKNIPPENFVKIENLNCPLLYILGEDDLSCAAVENADEIEKRLRAVGKSHLFNCVSYPGAGHLIEPPYTPNARASLWTTRPTKLITLWGGNLAQHAVAQEDSWKRILGFLDLYLRQSD